VHVAIRTDVSVQIGSGHFMRCLTLADALKQRGAQINFVCRYLPDHLRDMLIAKGHTCALLDSSHSGEASDGLSHARWLGTSQAADAKHTAQALSGRAWDWLVVDHYALDVRWESVLRRTAENIFVIDDIADRQHNCDVLLDQNYYADMDARYKGRVPAHCQLLLGPRYILLREEFQQMRKHAKVRCGPVKQLLVIFGGVDADNYTGCVIDALANLELNHLRVDVVIGLQHPFRERIVSDCLRLGYMCHLQTSRMAELMASADLAIGACGFTSYEFASMQLPAVLIPVTDVQTRVLKGLSKKGIAYPLFLKGSDGIAEITAAIRHLIESESHRSSISSACHDFLDANGANRVVDEIYTFKDQQ
jgi:UDP-2,4-diacetamido-2,4,6-trideoxy-beta-L-altropyranose hydrolase